MIITVSHDEFVTAVQRAMADKLREDGRLFDGMELGVTFYTRTHDDMQVEGKVKYKGKVLDKLTMHGGKQQLSAIATQIALTKLRNHGKYKPNAKVDFRLLEADELQVFAIDVEFEAA